MRSCSFYGELFCVALFLCVEVKDVAKLIHKLLKLLYLLFLLLHLSSWQILFSDMC